MNTIKVKNIAELKNRKGTSESTVEVLGYYTEGDGGGGEFFWDNNSVLVDNEGTVIQVTGVTIGRWIRYFDQNINIKWFGSKGDNITDDANKIQKVLDYSNTIGGATIIIPKGNYKLFTKLYIYSNTSLVGLGDSRFIYNDIADYGITTNNQFSNSVLLAINTIEGDKTITVASGTGINFTVGGFIHIEESNIQLGYNFSGVYTGQILSISGDILTLSKPIAYSFTTANSARVFYFTSTNDFYSNITIRNIKFECVSTTPSNYIGFIFLDKVNNVIIENNTFKNCNGEAVFLRASLNSKIANNYFLNIRTISGVSVNLNFCNNIQITDNKIEKSAFGINISNCLEIDISKNTLTGYKNVFNGRGIKLQFNSKYCSITNNKITNTGLYGIYIADSNHNIISENTLYNCGDVGEYAITSGGYLTYLFDYNIISKNIIVSNNVSYGILIFASGANTRKTYNIISSNIIKNVKNSIVVITSGNNIESNIITGAGIGQDSLSLTTNTTENVVINNTIKNNSSGYAINSYNSAGNNFIVDNNTKYENIILHDSDNINYRDNIIKTSDTTFNASSITGNQYGGLFIKSTTGVNNNAVALTFGYNANGTVGNSAGAGIYVQSSSSYGSRMFLGTTNNFSNISSKVLIDENGSITLGDTTSNTASIMNLVSNNKGFLPPRMTTAQKNAIVSPVAGLIVYDVTLNKLCIFTTTWETITSS